MSRRITPPSRARREQSAPRPTVGSAWDATPILTATAIPAARDVAEMAFDGIIFWHRDRNGEERPVLMPLRRPLLA